MGDILFILYCAAIVTTAALWKYRPTIKRLAYVLLLVSLLPVIVWGTATLSGERTTIIDVLNLSHHFPFRHSTNQLRNTIGYLLIAGLGALLLTLDYFSKGKHHENESQDGN